MNATVQTPAAPPLSAPTFPASPTSEPVAEALSELVSEVVKGAVQEVVPEVVSDVAAWVWPRRKLLWSEVHGAVSRSFSTTPAPAPAPVSSPKLARRGAVRPSRPLRWNPGVLN